MLWDKRLRETGSAFRQRVLCRIPVGIVSLLDDASLHLSCRTLGFLDRQGDILRGPLVLQIWLLWFFLLGVFIRLFIVKNCKMWTICVTEFSQLQSASAIKCLSVPGKKLSIFLMCVVPLMVPILRYNEHIRNFVRSSSHSPDTVYSLRCIILYFIVI